MPKGKGRKSRHGGGRGRPQEPEAQLTHSSLGQDETDRGSVPISRRDDTPMSISEASSPKGGRPESSLASEISSAIAETSSQIHDQPIVRPAGVGRGRGRGRRTESEVSLGQAGAAMSDFASMELGSPAPLISSSDETHEQPTESSTAEDSNAPRKASTVKFQKTILPFGNKAEVMQRPNKGKTGDHVEKVCQLFANHFEIKFGTEMRYWQYDVEITREKPPRRGESQVKKNKEDRGVPVRKRTENYEAFRRFVECFSSRQPCAICQHKHSIAFPSAEAKNYIYDKSKILYVMDTLKLQNVGVEPTFLSHPFKITEKDSPKTLYFMTIKQSVESQPGNNNGDNSAKTPVSVVIGSGRGRESHVEAGYRHDPSERNRTQLMLMNLLFKQGFAVNNNSVFEPFGRSMYDPRDRIDLGAGREMLRGFYQTHQITGDWRITFNFDIVASAFHKYKPPQTTAMEFAWKYVLERKGPYPPYLDHRDLRTLDKEFRGLNIKNETNKFTFKCHSILSQGADQAKFQIEKYPKGPKDWITVLDYFENKKQPPIKIKYPKWPVIQKGRGEKANYFPMEVCSIHERQRVPNSKLTGRNQQEIIKRTALPPDERMNKIVQKLQEASAEIAPALPVGMSLNMRMKEVEGRILRPPGVKYSGQEIMPREGKWNLQKERFNDPYGEGMENWALIIVGEPERDRRPIGQIIGGFLRELIHQGREKGLNINDPLFDDMAPTERDLEATFKEAISYAKQKKVTYQMVLIILPKQSKCYELVKYLGDHEYDVMTQVLRWPTVERGGPQIAANILLKLNTKLGGGNVILGVRASHYFQLPILFIGGDVTHPDPGDKSSPSIAGIVSNIDMKPQKYFAQEILQPSRQEIIDPFKMRTAVGIALTKFWQSTGMKPVKIIYYRDGVSEGQFDEVQLKELCGIQLACKEKNEDYRPQITFIVVQKRHHTRLFKKNMPQGPRVPATVKNIDPGTTVDTEIVHPYEFDFYLCSHQGIQGTSKPTHYYVLSDDSGYSADDIQIITNNLCYTYERCTRAVSIPAPCYYAHLIAFRARSRYIGFKISREGSSTVSSADEELTPEMLAELENNIKIGENTGSHMYFQ